MVRKWQDSAYLCDWLPDNAPATILPVFGQPRVWPLKICLCYKIGPYIAQSVNAGRSA